MASFQCLLYGVCMLGNSWSCLRLKKGSGQPAEVSTRSFTTDRFSMRFQPPEGAIISIGTVDRRLGWGSIPIAPSCGKPEIHIY